MGERRKFSVAFKRQVIEELLSKVFTLAQLRGRYLHLTSLQAIKKAFEKWVEEYNFRHEHKGTDLDQQPRSH